MAIKQCFGIFSHALVHCITKYLATLCTVDVRRDDDGRLVVVASSTSSSSSSSIENWKLLKSSSAAAVVVVVGGDEGLVDELSRFGLVTML
jgi:hypothetical protein